MIARTSGHHSCVRGGPPIVVLGLGDLGRHAGWWSLLTAGVIWSIGIFWIGVECLRNALRCGRVHCYVLGIAYPFLALLALGIALEQYDWGVFWNYLFFPITIIAFLPECFGKKYVG